MWLEGRWWYCTSFSAKHIINASRTDKNCEPKLKQKCMFTSTLVLINILVSFVFYEKECQYGVSLNTAGRSPVYYQLKKEKKTVFCFI